MTTKVIYANGHPRLYQTDEEELRASLGENARARSGALMTRDPENLDLNWWPSSVDFRAEARRHSRRPHAVRNFQQFLTAIRQGRNLNTVIFIGHGGRDLLKFSDDIYIRTENIDGRNYDVSRYFAAQGRIILYACNAAHTPGFISALATSLNVTVCGFRSGVRWKLDYEGQSPNRRITWRGIQRPRNEDPLPAPNTCQSPQSQPDVGPHPKQAAPQRPQGTFDNYLTTTSGASDIHRRGPIGIIS